MGGVCQLPVAAERCDLIRAKVAALRRFLNHSLHCRCLKAAIDHLGLVDRGEQPLDLRSPVSQRLLEQPGGAL